MTTTAITLTPGAVLGLDNEKTMWPADPEDLLIPIWDTGVFINEMAKLDILPAKLRNFTDDDKVELEQNPENLLAKAQEQAPDSLKEGTWRGTQLGLTKIYELIEKRYFDPFGTLHHICLKTVDCHSIVYNLLLLSLIVALLQDGYRKNRKQRNPCIYSYFLPA